jgi:DNA-binding transcriptional LysR family regulator
MPTVGTPTFDQLKVFLAVVETGSFAGAGRRLNRATSVISYAIVNLEAQLGLPLFDREGTRKPTLTVAGNALLAEARTVAHGIDGLRAKAKGLIEGLEAEVHLAVDVMLPAARLADVLKQFREAFPTVSLRLSTEALGAIAALVLDGKASVGIGGPVTADIEGLERVALGSVPLVPVAAPGHPLAQMKTLTSGAGREHIQLVLTDRSPLTQGRDFSVFSSRTWRLADLGSKHALLRECIGWGNMPVPLIEADLESGALVRLDMPDHQGVHYHFDGFYRSDAPPGPAGSWLLQRFAEHAADDPRPKADGHR